MNKIIRRRSILAATILLTIFVNSGSTKGERWSRQVSNSEWIPLANPRSLPEHTGGSLSGIGPSGVSGNPAQIQPLALPPALRQQYQHQLYQLQETQESIQKLLLLQQQLRAQQQLLQAQSYVPEGFATDEARKAALHQSTIANLQTLPHLAPDALLPPPPGDQPQPPEFPAQEFLVSNVQKLTAQQNLGNLRHQETASGSNEETKRDEVNEEAYSGSEEKSKDHSARQGGHYKSTKLLRDNKNGDRFAAQTVTPGSLDAQNDGEEEVQLLYVPAETLAQRDSQQIKPGQRVRNRKQYASHQHQQQQQQQQQQQTQQQNQFQQQDLVNNQGLEGTRPNAAQQAFAHQVLYQLQQEQAERDRIHKEEREKELDRLKEEEKELERRAKHHQEFVIKEQELKRQKELELRKELERKEEEARQKELQKLRELKQRKLAEEEAARKKEFERQELLERQKIAELRAQDRKQKEAEARQAEIDRLAALERQKELEIQRSLEQQRELERLQAEDEARARALIENQRLAQANAQLEAHRQAHQEAIETQRQAQIDAAKIDAQNRAQNQAQQQHLTETTKPKSSRIKGRLRHRNRQENQPTTPSPNQPPLSVYMGGHDPAGDPDDLRVSDVLTILKNAKTISVLDSVGPDAPQIFVGPTNLDPPNGYAKFDLPYLSSIDNNRVERKVDKLPFFVAPLSFRPPPGYSKIPFPAPHIGSVVVNNLDNEPDGLDGPPGGVLKTDEELRPNLNPLIESNSYVEGTLLPPRFSYSPQITSDYVPEALVATTTPKYEAVYSPTPSSGTRFRHRQFYNERLPVNGPSSATESGGITRTKFRQYYNDNPQVQVTPTYNSATTPSPDTAYQTHAETNFETPTPEGSIAARLPLINRESNQNGDARNRYNFDQQAASNPFQATQGSGSFNPSGESDASEYLLSENQESQVDPGDQVRASPGPTQYSIHSELPNISPQLPGLVNSLLDHPEPSENIVTTTTTTTTTTEAPTTTYRSRGRQRGRVVPTRAPTTTESTPTRSHGTDRQRRPYSRSRIRQGYQTTTENYPDATYNPTKSKFSAATQEKTHHQFSSSIPEPQRRPSARSQRYRGKGSDRNAVQPEARPEAAVSQAEVGSRNQENQNFPNVPNSAHSLRGGNVEAGNPTGDEISRPNALPLQGNPQESALAQEVVDSSFQQDDISEIQGINYQSGFKTSNFGQPNVEQNPVNGFNYQSQNEHKLENTPQATPGSTPQQYPAEIYNFYGNQDVVESSGKENVNFESDQIYGSAPQKPIGPANQETQYPKSGPVYDHSSSDVNKDNFQQQPTTTTTTTTEAPEVTTPRPTLTPAPVIIRQRLRSRLNSNAQRVPHADSPIQTRPTGSRDEFVRFNAVNHDSRQQSSSSSSARNQQATRPRLRNRVQGNQPNVQTEGDDYVRIQTPHQKPTTTTTTTTTSAPESYAKESEEEVEYGFIRPPSFKPIYPVNEKFNTANLAATYKPKYEQVQSEESSNNAPVEVDSPQSQILQKNRQKYQVTNRRPLTRSTTSSPTTTTAEIPEEEVYTLRPKVQNEEWKVGKTRGRTRRPGKRRTTTTSTTTTTTTTTTESILDSSNELPLDENYPQIIQGVSSPAEGTRRTLFDEELKSSNLENLPQAEALLRTGQLDTFRQQENVQLPRQDFVLNFGIGPSHQESQEDYDQTQLASSLPRKYSYVNRKSAVRTRPENEEVPDVEGAESQWSTKLTHASFQPSSLPNRVQSVAKDSERQEKSDDSFDIITAGPDLSSAEVLVTSSISNAPRDVVVNTSYFGNDKKEAPQEPPMLQLRSTMEEKSEDQVEKDVNANSDGLEFWNNGADNVFGGNSFTPKSKPNEVLTTLNIRQDNPEETTAPVTTILPESASSDLPKNASSEPAEEPKTTKRTGHRRRRVRIRVRPADDFVSAESQHVGSAWNHLIQGKDSFDKNSRFEEPKPTTYVPTSSTTELPTTRSFLDELFDEMSKNKEEFQVAAISTTTDVPDDPEPSIRDSTKHYEESTTETTTTTLGTTTTSSKTLSENPDPTTANIDLRTTLPDEKLATQATTERHNLSSKSREKKIRPFISLEKYETTEATNLEHHRFHPKQSQKNWWYRDQESSTEEKSKPFTPKFVTNYPKVETEATTITTESPEQASPSSQSMSDYVNAFFKSFESHEDQDEENAKELLRTTEASSTTTLKTEEETIANFKTDESTTVYSVGKVVEEMGKENNPLAEGEESVTIPTRVEETTLQTTSAPEVTSHSVLHTTQEVPFSPEELTTTEIPSTTTTLRSTSMKTNPSTINDLSKVLRTSTTTEISHMTEICYRGRCVKTKSRKEVRRK